MTALASTAVRRLDDGITVDAEILAPKLGLSVEALKAYMAQGLVTGVTETGIGDDAGRLRLTFRYRTKVWRVVVEPDGTLREAPLAGRRMGPAARARLDLLDLVKAAS